ncbi:hemolysin III family protein, partial [Streptomyces corynorhini]
MNPAASDPPANAPQSEGGPVEIQLPSPVKPKLRGWLHAGMFPAVLVAGVAL